MLNRVIVTIDGFDYTVISEDPAEYIRKNAELVDRSIQEVKDAAPLSSLTATVLAAMNLSDRYFRALEASDGLRLQIKDYAEECGRLRTELNRLKKESAKKD